jgi:POT family proton-dependent oligopeptide transporter
LSTVLTTPRADFLGHPRGLVTLAGTELWERISFHGMVALLTLYMVEQLLLPGHIEKVVGFSTYRHLIEGVTGPLSLTALATQTFGLYIGLIYFTPILGGLIGDRYIGRRNAVVGGCVLMTFGHFCMAFDQSFLLALLLLILGAGLLRGNLIAQVGGLYEEHDARSLQAQVSWPWPVCSFL